jgi:alpha-N-acetylglucosamine transferase
MINENEQLEIIPSENHQQIVNDEINNHRITEMEMKDNSEKLKIDNESRKMSINIGENSPDKNGHTETIHLNLIDKVHDASQIPKAEERSSIFNSKFLVNKSDLENFYEQNPFLHFNNIYDDHHQIHEEMNNLIYDEKLDFPFKSSLKVHAPNERSTPEKVIKRKKNMNNLKKEVDNDITPPNFEKAPILESPMKEEEQPRFPYKPINAEKEEKMEKFLEQ